jgi:hypothetical protein
MNYRRALSLAVLIGLAIFASQLRPERSLADTASPAATRPIAALSVKERTTLPASTRVTVGKRVTTLGVLRTEHLLALKRFANASSLGKSAGTVVALKGYQVSKKTSANIATIIAGLKDTAVIEPASGYSAGGLDMQAFCNAAQATVCLYYPASTTLCQCGGWASVLDPYITDPKICAAENGVLIVSGCQYNYPTYYTAQFNPGTGPPFAYKVACDPKYWKINAIDPHGAVAITTTVPEGQNFTTGSSPSTCVVRVWLSQ